MNVPHAARVPPLLERRREDERVTQAIFSGGCSCGQLRFSCTAPPLVQLVCHCRDCLKRTGPYTGILFVSPAALTVTGDTDVTRYTGGSGAPIHLYRCATCASPVTASAGAMADAQLVLAQALDRAEDFAPQCHVFVAGKPDWVSIDDELPQFAGSTH